MLKIVLSLVVLNSVYSISRNKIGKGSVVDFALKTFYQDPDNLDVAAILQSAGANSFTILRERLDDIDFSNHDETGLNIVMDYNTCTHAKCDEARAKAECTYINTDTQISKLILRRDSALTSWLVDCLVYAKVELPSEDGGVPGARTGAGDTAERGRLGGQTVQTVANDELSDMNIETQTVHTYIAASPAPVSSDASNTETVIAPDCSDKIFKTDMYKFHTDCCMRREFSVAAKDHRCSLSQMMNKIIMERDATTTTTTTASPDISRLGKSLDISDQTDLNKTESAGYDKQAADLMFQEMSGELSGWKSKYYVCLGFFLVFFAFFVITIAVLVYKLRTQKAGVGAPLPSPGGLTVPGQRARGYSAIDGDNDGRAPLTPATQQAQAFQY